MSANKSLAYNLTPKVAVAGSAAGAVVGPVIDTAGFNEACVILVLGATNGTLDVIIEESATGLGSWTTLYSYVQLTASDDGSVIIGMIKLDGNSAKRYLRVTSTVEALMAADHAVTMLLANYQYHPDQVPAFTI